MVRLAASTLCSRSSSSYCYLLIVAAIADKEEETSPESEVSKVIFYRQDGGLYFITYLVTMSFKGQEQGCQMKGVAGPMGVLRF